MERPYRSFKDDQKEVQRFCDDLGEGYKFIAINEDAFDETYYIMREGDEEDFIDNKQPSVVLIQTEMSPTDVGINLYDRLANLWTTWITQRAEEFEMFTGDLYGVNGENANVILYNRTLYFRLHDVDITTTATLEDRVYAASRNLFMALEDINDYCNISPTIGLLVGGIALEERTADFAYQPLTSTQWDHIRLLYGRINRSYFPSPTADCSAAATAAGFSRAHCEAILAKYWGKLDPFIEDLHNIAKAIQTTYLPNDDDGAF